jgi:hypothetical protein
VPAPEGDPGAAEEDGEAPPAPRAAIPEPCAPADLVETTLARLDVEEAGARPVTVEVAPDLPMVEVDAGQVVSALVRLLQNAAHRAGQPDRVFLRVFETKAVPERGVRPEPFVRMDIVFPREEMTEEDLRSDPETERNRELRRQDAAIAEQLLQANGGRLVQQPMDEDRRLLSVFLPTAP